MDPILGIDLGTTNSAVSIIENGKAIVLSDERGESILPSVVGFDANGSLLVGQAARNQALIAPQRTVKSIKRQMGREQRVRMGDQEYSPQEISAMILRTLKERAELALGRDVTKAVITVPAFFKDAEREATREAGELAGLEVVRIINEPTAAALTYEPHSERNERLLVYDLGGGTFDVSIVQIERGVIEVLASHGDTHLGGDDFDDLLLNHVCDKFQEQHGIDLRQIPTSRSRMLQAVEEAKKRLSFEACTTIAEEFIAEKDGSPLNFNMEIERLDYERLIESLVVKTLHNVDAALNDAKMTAKNIDRVILVGGSSRTPLVHRMLVDQLGHEPHLEVDPDLCVSLGAAIQGGLIAGIDVGPVLVDITPHTLGVQCVGEMHGIMTPNMFSAIIPRNTPLPATRSEMYYTCYDGQDAVQVHVLQGENKDVRFNQSVGEFMLEGLNEEAEQGSEILVRFDLNLDGILTVAAIERETGLEKKLTIDNAITRFRAKSREEAKSKLAAIFGDQAKIADAGRETSSAAGPASDANAGPRDPAEVEAVELISKARRMLGQASSEDADEMRELLEEIGDAVARHDAERIRAARERLEDLVFYLEDA